MKAPWKEKCVGTVLQLEYGKPLDHFERKRDGLYPVYGANGEKARTDKFYFDKETIIVGRKGSAGELNLTEPKFWPLDVTYFVTFDEQQHGLRFLYYLLMTLDLPHLAKGVKPGITRNEVYSQIVKVPPLPEQQRIVAILDEAFKSIAIAKANVGRNLHNARALFESCLQSVFSQRDYGWVETTLEHVLSVQPRNGWSPSAANHAASGVPVLTLSSVTGFNFRVDKIKFTSARTDPHRHYWVRNGDFLITRSNTPELVGHVAIASGITEPTVYPDLIMRMTPASDRVLTEFLYYQMRTPSLRLEITRRAQGASPTMKKISKGAVQSLPIAMPSLPQQKEIVTKLEAILIETQHLESIYRQKLSALDALKKSLLHQAFAGEL